jgi:hypothetical protein
VANIPVGRTVQQVSVVVPTAAADTYGVGFAGAQSAENAYILDGLNVTDPVYGTFGGNPVTQTPQTTLLTNFIQEIDVKTGGFMPEYGRATGGVLNMIIPSGGNEFHGAVFANYTPRMLYQSAGTAAGTAGDAIAWRTLPKEGAYDLDAGVHVGGPIMKDRLWFFGGFAPVITRKTTERFLRTNVLDPNYDPNLEPNDQVWDNGADGCLGQNDPARYGRCIRADGTYLQNKVAGSNSVVDTGRTTYQVLGKLTYLLDENNNFSLAAYALPSTTSNFFMTGAAGQRKLDTDDNLFDVVGRYAGKYLDKRLVVEAVGGYHRSSSVDQPTSFQQNTSSIEFQEDMNITQFEAIEGCNSLEECPTFQYRIGGSRYLNDTLSDRIAGRVAASYLSEIVGSHNTKVGVDVERSTYRIKKDYGGDGYYYAFPSSLSQPLRLFRGYGAVTDANAEGFGTTGTSFTVFGSLENTSATTSTAIFAQDSWQLPVANVTVNYGIRWEGQSMQNQDNPDQNGFDIYNNWAPRVQAIWDFTGNGRGKAAGNWGRFFYSMPLDMGDRAFGNESQLRYRLPRTCGGFGDAVDSASPEGWAAFDPTLVVPGQSGCDLVQRGAGVGGSSTPWYTAPVGGFTPVDPDIQGVYVDQFGGQLEYEVLSDLSVGLEYNGRRQGQTIEDMSSDDGGHYYIGNPGYGDGFEQDGVVYSTTSVDTFDAATGRVVTAALPKPERSYDGFTFFLRKNLSKHWQGAASYTYSYLRGNLAGPFRVEDGQIDPGITSEYDLASLTANRNGLLPGDMTHAIKLFGSYTFNFGPRFNATTSAGFTSHSGVPVSVLGSHPDYGEGQAFILPRGMGGRSAWEHQLDLGGKLEYVIKPPYAIAFSVNVFNVFNTQEIEVTDENYTYDAVQPITGLKCDTSAPTAGNPLQKLQSDCPDLAFLKTTDGRPAVVNPNWGRAFPGTGSFQIPLELRLGLALSF